MKNLFGKLILSGIVVLTPMLSMKAEETSIWLVGKGRELSGGIIIPDSKGAFDLQLKDSTGVTFGPKPPKGDDTKSLVFSGTQTAGFRTTQAFPSPTGRLKVDAQVLIGDVAAGNDASILRLGTQWELRYMSNSKQIAFVVWHDKNVFSNVQVPINPGDWEEISAEYTPEQMILRVGNEEKMVVPKDIMHVEAAAAHLMMGASTSNQEDPSMIRLFIGSLADVRVAVE